MNVNDMISSIADSGVMRPHQYAVRIEFPTGTELFSTELPAELAPRIERCTLPAMALEIIEYPSASRGTFPIVKSAAAYDPVNIGIILSEDAREKRVFDDWYKIIHSKQYTRGLTRFYDDYIGSMTVSLISSIDPAGRSIFGAIGASTAETVASYKFTGVYPINVGDIELSYADNDAYTSLAISFNWNDFEQIK